MKAELQLVEARGNAVAASLGLIDRKAGGLVDDDRFRVDEQHPIREDQWHRFGMVDWSLPATRAFTC